MRIRTIKPEFWQNEKLASLPEGIQYFAAAILNYADDRGYFNANPSLIKAALYPLREPSVSIQVSLSELSKQGYLALGEGADGRRYGWVVHFDDHQRVNRPSDSKIKPLCEFSESSVNTHGVLTDDSLLEQGTGNREQGRRNREQGTGDDGGGDVTPCNEIVTPPIPSAFDLFWDAYPRAEGKKPAAKAFLKVKVPVETLLDAIDVQKRWPQWIKENGQFIPMAATWLNNERWNDKPFKPNLPPPPQPFITGEIQLT